MTRHTLQWGKVLPGRYNGDSLQCWPRIARKAASGAFARAMKRYPGARVVSDQVEARPLEGGLARLYRCVTIEVDA